LEARRCEPICWSVLVKRNTRLRIALPGSKTIGLVRQAKDVPFLPSSQAKPPHTWVCVTSDARGDLVRAIEKVFYGSAWQPYIVHEKCDVCSMMRARHQRNMTVRLIRVVFKEADPALDAIFQYQNIASSAYSDDSRSSSFIERTGVMSHSTTSWECSTITCTGTMNQGSRYHWAARVRSNTGGTWVL